MGAQGDHDFNAPFVSDTLLEIRTSRMKLMPGLTVTSGIDKQLRDGPMKIDKVGMEGDEHDLTFHGGPDKAILGCEPPAPFHTKCHATNLLSKTAPLTIPIGEPLTQNVPTSLCPEASARILLQLT